MKNAQNGHSVWVFGIDYDVVGAHNHLTCAIDTPNAIHLRMIW